MPEIVFNGPAGRLEGRYTRSTNPNAPIVVLLHPHPQHGGTMNNKVLYMMHQAFVKNGFATLRFNFRGVGKSQGTYDEGIGELADATAALDWMQSVHKTPSQMWVAGFSFGAWISMQLLMRRPEIDGFVSVAPPANLYDFSFLAPCPCGGLIVHGAKDKIASQSSIEDLVERLQEQRGSLINYQNIEEAGHFFKDNEEEFQEILNDYIASVIHYRAAAE